MSPQPLNITVVGAGSIAEQGHVPAIQSLGPDFVLHSIVDRDLDRARYLAQPSGARALTDHRQAIDGADLAIIATPPGLHAGMTRDFLDADVAVLVEKPMATSTAEARSMVEAAARSSAVLAIGHSRRTYPLLRFARQALVERRAIGNLRRVLLCMGNFFHAWHRASDYVTDRGMAGGGVVQNYGPHLFDIVEDWFPDARLVHYEDDARGGIEMNARALLETDAGVEIELRMSYTDRMGTECWFEGEDAVASFSPGDTAIRLDYHDGETARLELPDRDLVDLPWAMARQLENVREAMEGRAEPLCRPESGLWVVSAIEECYARSGVAEPEPA